MSFELGDQTVDSRGFINFRYDLPTLEKEEEEPPRQKPSKALPKPTEEMKRIIFDWYAEGIPNKETAKKLNISSLTVYRALRMMREPCVAPIERDPELHPQKELIRRRISLCLSIDPLLTARNIRYILSAEGFFLSEKILTQWKKGLYVALNLKSPISKGHLIPPAAYFVLDKLLGHSDISLESGIIFLSFKQMDVHVRRVGGKVSLSGSEGAGQGVRTFFSMLLAICGSGVVFFDSPCDPQANPPITESLKRLFCQLSGSSRVFLVASDFPCFDEFRALAARCNHTVYTMPPNMCHRHLGEIAFYNLPRWLRRHDLVSRSQIEGYLEEPLLLFPALEITGLYFRACRVSLNTNPVPPPNLPPSTGIVPSPLKIPDIAYFRKAQERGKAGSRVPPHEITSILQEYEAMLMDGVGPGIAL